MVGQNNYQIQTKSATVPEPKTFSPSPYLNSLLDFGFFKNSEVYDWPMCFCDVILVSTYLTGVIINKVRSTNKTSDKENLWRVSISLKFIYRVKLHTYLKGHPGTVKYTQEWLLILRTTFAVSREWDESYLNTFLVLLHFYGYTYTRALPLRMVEC